jgi:hypothetical protein
MFRFWFFGIVVGVSILAACGPSIEAIQTAMTQTEMPFETLAAATLTAKAAQQKSSPTGLGQVLNTPNDTAALQTPIIPTAVRPLQCVETASVVGQNVTCMLVQAICQQAKGSSQPTFCSDELPPRQHFTVVVWGSDWTHYAGKCMIITGQVAMSQGNPRIVVRDLSQISICP